MSEPLTPTQWGVLRVEADSSLSPVAKNLAIGRLGLSNYEYTIALNGLLDHPVALERYPTVVWRLRRKREERQLRRTALRQDTARY